MCEPNISQARQLLGLLNFCLLSRAESEMERIDLLSAGGALPWAGPLARSAPMKKALSISRTHPPISITHLSLSLRGGSPPPDTCPAVCVGLLKPGLISLLFPISSTSKKGEEGRKYHQPPPTNKVWYGKGMENVNLTVWLVVGERIVAHCCATTAKVDALMLPTTVAFHSSYNRKSLHTHTPPKNHWSAYLKYKYFSFSRRRASKV